MPSTFLRTAVDLDGDGRKDLINSVPDALGSTANYLRKAAGRRASNGALRCACRRITPDRPGARRKEPMAAWAARGITKIDGSPLGGGPSAGLLLPAGPNGPAFLVTHNFDAIYSYNAAESYALGDRPSVRPAARAPRARRRPGRPTTPACPARTGANCRRC